MPQADLPRLHGGPGGEREVWVAALNAAAPRHIDIDAGSIADDLMERGWRSPRDLIGLTPVEAGSICAHWRQAQASAVVALASCSPAPRLAPALSDGIAAPLELNAWEVADLVSDFPDARDAVARASRDAGLAPGRLLGTPRQVCRHIASSVRPRPAWVA